MGLLHEGERVVDADCVRQLLRSQCPQWVDLPLTIIESSGTDNALFRLGQDLVVRFPRIDWAVNSIEKEFFWVPQLAKHLDVPLSEPIFLGSPEGDYPWLWLVLKWNRGENPPFETKDEYGALAVELVQFLNQLHGASLERGPFSRRGVHLSEKHSGTTGALKQLTGEVDVNSLIKLWNNLSVLPPWSGGAVWVHGDFLPGNILVEQGHLSAVIDFSDVGMGDPACDMVIAWALLNRNSREIFRVNLPHIDDNTWQRGRGWALSIAAIMLPYYKDTNPTLATLSRRMLASVLEEV